VSAERCEDASSKGSGSEHVTTVTHTWLGTYKSSALAPATLPPF
jgi:hypothetical protein